MPEMAKKMNARNGQKILINARNGQMKINARDGQKIQMNARNGQNYD